MTTQDVLPEADEDSLRVQLTELNNRSRWYSSQLWQLPFAYLGVTGVAIASLINSSPAALTIAVFAAAAFGILVLLAMRSMNDGQNRAVRNLQLTEEALRLRRTAELWPGVYGRPFFISVVLAIALCVALGSYLVAEPSPQPANCDASKSAGSQ